MKKFITAIMALFIGVLSFAQTTTNDKMVKHNGEKLEVKVIKVGETTITFKYPGEDAEQVIGKYAVAYITYGGSGRKENITAKVLVSGKSDWENVVILTDKSQVLGLKEGEAVRGKTSGWLSYNTAGSADKKATRKIKEAAAELGASFVLLTSDKNDGFGVKQSIKNGTTYSY